MIRSAFTLLALIAMLLMSCEKDELKLKSAHRGDIIEIKTNGNLTKAEIEARINEFSAEGWAEYDVTFSSITYRTEYMGKPIDTRGLLLIPNGIDSVDLLMHCHGTEIPSKLLHADNITPSLYTGSTDNYREVRNMGLGWASKGFVVFIPDYIGYGLTLGKEHPYMYFPEMFLSNIDGLLAVKKYLSENNYSYDNQLFLTCWSLGGGACLSAHKYIQEQYAAAFTVAASSSLAGVLNYEKYHDKSLKSVNEKLGVMPIISWSVYSINKFSPLKRPTDQIYSYPVFDQMSSIVVPSFQPNKVFKPYFLSKVLDGTDTQYRTILTQNSFYKNWTATGKVFLHHGDADDTVPYYNSTDAKEGLEASGSDVTLYTYTGGNHDTELGNFIKNTFNDFNQLR